MYISEGKDTGLLQEAYTASGEHTDRVTPWLTLPCTSLTEEHTETDNSFAAIPLFSSLFTKHGINFRKQSVRFVVTV